VDSQVNAAARPGTRVCSDRVVAGPPGRSVASGGVRLGE